MTNMRNDKVRMGALALALTVGTVGVTGVAAQDTETPPADETVTAQPVDLEPRDEGFDDWGLLGLLGLAGLLGLRRQPARPMVVEERVTATETRRP